jgi:hypothetical protein
MKQLFFVFLGLCLLIAMSCNKEEPILSPQTQYKIENCNLVELMEKDLSPNSA